eukprot:TRINITY_DN8041_c0_g1_i1.p2 TRINITY_DN8041_c0_g1~~TRINITY_DN8041_c0_g1_i1.p2  ORF type:complete len:163 (+),score=31.35 TRINITY_DN8041_c0_g1_i1:106-594(+)
MGGAACVPKQLVTPPPSNPPDVGSLRSPSHHGKLCSEPPGFLVKVRAAQRRWKICNAHMVTKYDDYEAVRAEQEPAGFSVRHRVKTWMQGHPFGVLIPPEEFEEEPLLQTPQEEYDGDYVLESLRIEGVLPRALRTESQLDALSGSGCCALGTPESDKLLPK